MRALHNLFEKILQRKLKFSRFARVFKADISLFFNNFSLHAIDYIYFSMCIKINEYYIVDTPLLLI